MIQDQWQELHEMLEYTLRSMRAAVSVSEEEWICTEILAHQSLLTLKIQVDEAIRQQLVQE